MQEKNVQKAGKFLAVVSVENNLDRVRNTEKWKFSTPHHAEKTPDMSEIILYVPEISGIFAGRMPAIPECKKFIHHHL